MFEVHLTFNSDLQNFLHRSERTQPVIRRLTEKSSVKDIIESCGIPHPEVDLIVLAGGPIGFEHQIGTSAELTALSCGSSPSVFPEHRLQQKRFDRFVADGHLGKLARNLRLLGIDIAYHPTADDKQLLHTMKTENRALLTRDRRLLMHRVVHTGYSPRSDIAEEQTIEVIRRFDLVPRLLLPYSRCLRCNGSLESATKEDIAFQLEPLTKRFYHEFRRCRQCGQIYWSGSHAGRLEALIRRITGASSQS
jgi:uncharacterized protein with PIN domain